MTAATTARGTVGLPMETLHNLIRLAPKPVIAKVAGLCDRRRQRTGDTV